MALAAPQLRASDRTVRVNTYDHAVPGSKPTTLVRVGHLVRGTHTLCGAPARRFTWVDPDHTTTRCASCHTVPTGHATSRDILAATTITYRQLDHWCRTGLATAHDPLPGSGHQRSFPPDEYDAIVRMAALVNAGLNPAAARLAADGQPIAPGVHVVFEDAA